MVQIDIGAGYALALLCVLTAGDPAVQEQAAGRPGTPPTCSAGAEAAARPAAADPRPDRRPRRLGSRRDHGARRAGVRARLTRTTLRRVDDPRSLFAPEEIERARAYHRPLYVAWPARLAIDVVVLAAIAFSRFGNELFGALDDLSWWAQTLAYTVVATGVTALLTLPISFAAGYLRERAWGFSTQSTRGWFADRAKGLGVAVVLGCVVMLGFVGLARALPRSWPFAAAAAAAALVVLLTFVAPLILEPMFNRFSPLEDAELAESLRRLSEDAGVPIEQVLVADASRRTTKQNAYVSGLGQTRRLVLFDTLLADAERRELRLVLAHELGHRRARHIAQGTALGIAGAIAFVVLLWALLRVAAVARRSRRDRARRPAHRAVRTLARNRPAGARGAARGLGVADLGAAGRPDLPRADLGPRRVRVDDAQARAGEPRRPRPAASRRTSPCSPIPRRRSGSAPPGSSGPAPPGWPHPLVRSEETAEVGATPKIASATLPPVAPRSGAAYRPGRGTRRRARASPRHRPPPRAARRA